MPTRKKSTIPRFNSADDEAEFWDKHSPLDYPEEWTEVKRVKVDRLLGHILAVRLDAKTIDKLAAIAQQKGIGSSTLARMWLIERLAKLGEQEQKETRHIYGTEVVEREGPISRQDRERIPITPPPQ